MKKSFVFAILVAALLGGCAVPVYYPIQVAPTCPTESIGRWVYNAKEMKWDCVLRAYQPVVVYQPYMVIGPPVYYPQFGWWGVVVVARR